AGNIAARGAGGFAHLVESRDTFDVDDMLLQVTADGGVTNTDRHLVLAVGYRVFPGHRGDVKGRRIGGAGRLHVDQGPVLVGESGGGAGRPVPGVDADVLGHRAGRSDACLGD